MHRVLRTARTTGVFCLSIAGTAAALSGGRPQPPSADDPLLGRSGGALRLDSSRPDAAILGGTGLKPGSQVDGDIDLTAAGTTAADVTLALSDLTEDLGPRGGRLSSVLQLRVEEIPADGHVHVRYNGLLRDLGSQALGTFSAGETRHFHFVATLPDIPQANSVQGSSAIASFEWLAEEHPAAPPTPAPVPPPATRPPSPLRLRLVLPPRQHARFHANRVVGWVVCSRPCRIGLVAVAGDARFGSSPQRRFGPWRLEVVPASRQASRTRARVVLRLPRAARRALHRGLTLQVRVTASGTDRAGNRAQATGATRVRR
jgi:hypothetical protein